MIRKAQKVVTPLSAVTATTTSAAINLEGVERVSLFFTRADHSAGSTTFTVSVSADDTTYVTYNKLIDNVAIAKGKKERHVVFMGRGLKTKQTTLTDANKSLELLGKHLDLFRDLTKTDDDKRSPQERLNDLKKESN